MSLLALVLMGGAAVTVFAASRSADREPESLPLVVDVAPSAVSRLVVTSGERRAEVVRSGEGAWEARPGTSPQSATLLFNLEDRLLPMRAYRSVEADPAGAQFGLSEPAVVLRITGRDGEDRAVVIGGPSFNGAGYYAARQGHAGTGTPRLYLVPRETVDGLRSVATGVPVRPTDKLAERVAEVESQEAKAAEEARVRPYLRQASDAGARMPEGLE